MAHHLELTKDEPLNTDVSTEFSTPLTPPSLSLASPEEIKLPPSPPAEDHIQPETPLRRPSFPPRGESYPSNSSSPILGATHHLSHRPRTHSPSSSHIRPHSSGGMSSSTMMQRAHSSPGVDSSGRFVAPVSTIPHRPSSPLHSGRRRSPLRSGMDDVFPGTPSWSGLSIEPNIPEHAELEIGSDADLMPTSSITSFSSTFPRSRRRPTSPLHQSASAPSLYARSVSPGASGTVSPSLVVQKYANEPFPAYSFSSASSIPSTPTSLRSRSPSISSLETIEDTPDAEQAAMQEEEENRQKTDDIEVGSDPRRRSSLELRANNLRSNKERKRWSVCGAERRADFSLEPIEE